MPGTGLARHYGPVLRAFWDHGLPRLTPVVPFMSSTVLSGEALATLAAAPPRGVPSGAYVEVDRVANASPLARDARAAATLMRESAEVAIPRRDGRAPEPAPAPSR